MQLFSIQQLAGNTDIYLIDQILKGRYLQNDIVLDAGCGPGRNLHWFLLNQITCFGIDMDEMAIGQLKMQYPQLPTDRFQVGVVEKLPFSDCFFDHIISSAVLHFAKSQQHFFTLIGEMERVLQPGGSLFIRMTTDIGIENLVGLIEDGVYQIPDGSTRFLLTRPLLAKLLNDYPFTLIEEVKTVNVNDTRCMMTLMIQKNIES